MDDTQGSRKSDAATTRKRRSSILKSQRPPRTPLSELEFNVATPTDTAKNRRVSFSRRTGVAEFVTNEATNTWKTIYVEQNKSLESSGSDSVMNPPRQTIDHLGKRIFDQQFEEIEAIDYGGNIITSNHLRVQEMNMSMNVNLTQQIVSLEYGLDDRKLATPQQNFELSAFTDHKSNLFGDDLPIATVGDVSNKIDINFSAIQPVGSNNKQHDDLDEIQKDLLMLRPQNVQVPFNDNRNMSEYIEVDLNMTHVGMKNDDFDMSITETIQSPKVQEDLKSNISVKNEDKYNTNNDWIADKENIAINPYVAPKESVNFAINEIPDQVLVFDGRKLTLQSEKNIMYNNDRDNQTFRKTLLPNDTSCQPPNRKTIVLNTNDDLPNFVTNASLLGQNNLSMIKIADECRDKINKEFSLVHNINKKSELLPNSQNTIIYDSGDIANISVTQAISTNVLEQRLGFENETGNLSLTQAVRANIVMASNEMQPNKTVHYDVDNISFTQAVPINVLLSNNKNFNEIAMIAGQNDLGVSLTQAVPNNLIISNKLSQTNKRNTIVFESDTNDISVTRVLPSNILTSDKQVQLPVIVKKQFISENMEERMLPGKNRLYNDDECSGYEDITKLNDENQYEISETRILPTNIIEFNKFTEMNTVELNNNHDRWSITKENVTNMSITEAIVDKVFLANKTVNDKRNTLDYVNDICDISETKVLPSNIVEPKQKCSIRELESIPADKRESVLKDVRTIAKTLHNPESVPVYKNNYNETSCNTKLPSETSLTSFCSNKIPIDQKNTEKINITLNAVTECTSFYKSHVDMSITQVIHPNDTLINGNHVSKRETVVYNGDENDISVAQSIEANILLGDIKSNTDNKSFVDEKDSNEEQLTTMSICNCMVITSKQPCQMHICTHSNISISKEINAYHTTNNKSEIYNNLHVSQKSNEHCEKTGIVTDEAHLANTSVSENAPHVSEQDEIVLKSMNYLDSIVQNLETNCPKSTTDHNYQDVFVYQAVTSHNVSKHHIGRIDQDEKGIEEITNNEIKKSSNDLNKSKESDMKLLKKDARNEKKVENKETKKPRKEKKRSSFLSKLLNMSNDSINLSSEGIDDKNVMAVIESQNEMDTPAKFQLESTELVEETPEVVSESKEESIGTKSYLFQKKEDDNSVLEGKVNEKFENTNSEINFNKSMKSVESNTESEQKYLKQIDATNDLLETLKDLNFKSVVNQYKLSEGSSDPSEGKEDIATEDKFVSTVLKRSSLAPSRLSVMISREDLVNNISMAQAALQQAKDMEDSEIFNCTDDTTAEEPDYILETESDPMKQPVRVSTEVVKTLKFDDSAIDVISKSNSNLSPLKKTAFGDNSSLKDSKVKVIPSYLTDVSEDIKSLMKDLVKPAADVMPFETSGVERIADKISKKPVSTNSIEIQANIITSSQIDIDIDSRPVSEHNYFEHSKVHSKMYHSKPGTVSEIGIFDDKKYLPNNVLSKPYLIFDHSNPLNNVILSPSGTTDVHNYCPMNSVVSKTETAVHIEKEISKNSQLSGASEKDAKDEVQIQLVSTQYNLNINPIRSESRVNSSSDKVLVDVSVIAIDGKEKSDLSLVHEDNQAGIKDTETNTLIVMKCNQDLLETSSSLTIVEEDVHQVVVLEDTAQLNTAKKPKKISPVKVIFKLEDKNSENSELSELSDSDTIKAKKRIYSPAKYDHERTPAGTDVTSRHLIKIQKLSCSPHKTLIHRATTLKLNPSVIDNVVMGSVKSLSKSNNDPSKKSPESFTSRSKPRNSIIVQRMTTDCKIRNVKTKENVLVYDNDDSESISSSTLKSETISQKYLSSAHLTDSCTSNATKKVDCMPSLIITSASEGIASLYNDSSKSDYAAGLGPRDFNTGTGGDSGVDVSEKIERLPFIRTRECVWDQSNVDCWRFLLMRKVMLLTVRLQREGGAQRRLVCGNTGVVATVIEVAHKGTDEVAGVCTRLASEAMRYECVRGAARAADVPALLRRCVRVARLAQRWARAMHDARVHLAYKLADNGRLVLKVANVPLRVVYEVAMRIELVVEDARESAWARAVHMTMRTVTDDQTDWVEQPPAAAAVPKRSCLAADGARAEGEHLMRDVQRVLARVPHDWGHVPKTLWKVFRYLKNKTKHNDLLGI